MKYLMILVLLTLLGCSSVTWPCDKNADCDDSKPCTKDYCRENMCEHEQIKGCTNDTKSETVSDIGNETEFNPPLTETDGSQLADTFDTDLDTDALDNEMAHDDGQGEDEKSTPETDAPTDDVSETAETETNPPMDTVDTDTTNGDETNDAPDTVDANDGDTAEPKADTSDAQDAEADSTLPCIPNCANKQCGDDGCDGSCGICSDGYACTTDFICECVVGCQIPTEPTPTVDTADANDADATTADAKADTLPAIDTADATIDASPDETGTPPAEIVVIVEPSADADVAEVAAEIANLDITPPPPDAKTPGADSVEAGPDIFVQPCMTDMTLCDDGNICTDDDCDPFAGCGHTDNTVACDDNNACTTGDVCVDSACQSNGFIVCEDINPCTNNTCDSGQGCIFVYNTAPCEDGNVLTINDQCQEGQCVSGPSKECDDENPCTDDTADPTKGCLHEVNTAPCSDGNLCTFKDMCENNVCVSGETLNCNDYNECTDEVCDSEKGCLYTYNSVACDDDNTCTSTDKCVAGECLGVAPLNCNDGNQCTIDTCNPASGCQNEPQTGMACNDGNACTTADACEKDVCAGKTIVCNDQNPCTDDSCDKQSGCVYSPNNANPCEDGSLCTVGDFCDAGQCQGGQALTCDDGNICTDNVCNSQKGCLYLPNQVGCDDGNSCTVGDTCAGGACESGTNICQCENNADCASADDENLCNGTVMCDQSAVPFQCVTDPNTIITCNPAKDTACLKNTCIPATGDCEMTVVNQSGSCDDGNACTSNDQCAGGACAGQSVKCDDSNVCTDDSCDPASGCVFTPNSADCDDGSVCTMMDVCQVGKCIDTAPLDCDDGKECTLDICHKTLGCQHSKTALNGQACDNGDACTVNDTCQNGVCQAGTQNNCDCYATADCASKEDGNLCNGTLVCDTSQMPHLCVLNPTTIITCPTTLDTTCSKNTCVPATGDCEMTAVNEGGSCQTGQCVASAICQIGQCAVTNKPDGAECDDDKSCNTDSCQSGICAGAPFAEANFDSEPNPPTGWEVNAPSVTYAGCCNYPYPFGIPSKPTSAPNALYAYNGPQLDVGVKVTSPTFSLPTNNTAMLSFDLLCTGAAGRLTTVTLKCGTASDTLLTMTGPTQGSYFQHFQYSLESFEGVCSVQFIATGVGDFGLDSVIIGCLP